jgi:hypothetical protein
VKQVHEISKQAHEVMKRELALWTKEVDLFRRQLSSCKETQAMLDRALESYRETCESEKKSLKMEAS